MFVASIQAAGYYLCRRMRHSLNREIRVLLEKEIRLEYRQKYAIGGVLLYVFATVFVVYSTFINIPVNVWNVQFWLILLFASVNALLKSFVQDSSERQIYLYTLVSPYGVILSKMLYNTLILCLICLLTFLAFALLAGSPVRDIGLFVLTSLAGSIGLSVAFTFIAAVASRGTNQATLMAILGFPVVIPILLILIKLSANALGLINDTAIYGDLSILAALDALLMGIAIYLFPYLWRD